MNIDDSVRVLNEWRYDIDEWRDAEWTKEGGEGTVLLVDKGERDQWDYHESLDEFEAIAIAEKLERDAGHDMPATRKAMRVFCGFVGHMRGLVKNEEFVTRNSSGGLSFGELLAAVEEWGYKP